MPQRLGEIVDPAHFESGIWKSVDVLKAPLWVDGSNVTFRKAQVEKARGYETFLTAGAAVNAVAQALVGGTKRVYLGEPTALQYYDDGGSVTTIASGLTSGQWSMEPWGSYLLATNNQDKLRLWPNTGTALEVSDAPATARIVRQLNVFTVLFDAAGTAGRFVWSDRGDPTVFTASLSNLAGGDYIRNINSRTQCAEKFANGLACWSSDQMYLVSYVGGTAVLSYRTLPANVGAAGLNSCVVVGSYAYGVEPRGFWKTDGLQVQWIAQPAMWDYLSGRIDFDAGDEITCHYDSEYECVEWHWKTQAAGYEGYAYNVRTGSWQPRDWKLTAAAGSAVWGKPIGANGTAVYKLSSGVNAGASALPAWVQTKPLAWGDTDVYKWLDELRLRKSGSANFQVGLLDAPDGTPEWLSAETMAERHYPMREAAFFVLKVASTAADADWSLAGIEGWGEFGGTRL